jgi:preprotein translocase subunit SecE
MEAIKSSSASSIAAWPKAIKEYVEDLQTEMRRVTWPPLKQVRATTLVVIVSVFAFAAYFSVVDYIVGRTITKIFDTMAK